MKKAIFSFLLSAAALSASTVSTSFVSADSTIGPYTLSINGKNVQAMCMDDFLEVHSGETWTANVTALNSTDFSNTYLGNVTVSEAGYNLTSASIYGMEAYLFSQIIQPNADRTDIQDAAWAIMDPATLNNVVTTNNTAVEGILQQALASSSSFNTSGYEIISGIGLNCDSPQEFIIQSSAAPEPATLALFGAGLIAAGAARFLRRKKTAVA